MHHPAIPCTLVPLCIILHCTILHQVNLYMGVSAGKPDLLAAKEDFRLNSQYVSVTFSLGEELSSTNRYQKLGGRV